MSNLRTFEDIFGADWKETDDQIAEFEKQLLDELERLRDVARLKWRTAKRIWTQEKKELNQQAKVNCLNEVERLMFEDAKRLIGLLLRFAEFCETTYPKSRKFNPLDAPPARHSQKSFILTPKEREQFVASARRVIPHTTPLRYDEKLAGSMEMLDVQYVHPGQHIADHPQLFRQSLLSSVAIYFEYLFSGKEAYLYRTAHWHFSSALRDLKRIASTSAHKQFLPRNIRRNKDIGLPVERITAGLCELVKLAYENGETSDEAAAWINQVNLGEFISMSQSELSRHLAGRMPDFKKLGLSQNASLTQYFMKFYELFSGFESVLFEITNPRMEGNPQRETDEEFITEVFRGQVSQIDLNAAGMHEICRRKRRRENRKRKVSRSIPE